MGGLYSVTAWREKDQGGHSVWCLLFVCVCLLLFVLIRQGLKGGSGPRIRIRIGPSSRQDEGITITAGGTMRDEDPAWQAIKRAAGTEHARDIFNTIHADIFHTIEPTRSRGMQQGADNSLHFTPEPGHSRTNLRRRINEVRKINMPRRIAPLTAQQRQRLGLDRRTSHDEDGMLM